AGSLEVQALLTERAGRVLNVLAELVHPAWLHADLVPVVVVLDRVRLARQLGVEPEATEREAHDGGSAEAFHRLQQPGIELRRWVHNAGRVLRARNEDVEDDHVWHHGRAYHAPLTEKSVERPSPA